MGLPPPYWAFAWAGGQALARYVLDQPETVAGKRVLDLAAGSGLVAIAAAKAGAAPVIAADIDAFTEPAIALNAEANDVYIEIITQDLLDHAAPPQPRYDVILVGDLFYERDTAARALAFLDRHAATGARVLIGDPGRTYLPKERLDAARRIFRAGDARAGGSGDQAHDRVGADVPRLILRSGAAAVSKDGGRRWRMSAMPLETLAALGSVTGMRTR